MRHTELSEAFVNGATKGRGSRMFIEGDVIYSYGHHFPIAKRHGDIFLFNSDDYSVSTQKHKGYVLTELNFSGKTVIKVPGCDLSRWKAQIEKNRLAINKYKDKLTRARAIHIKEHYARTIKELQNANSQLESMMS